MSKDYGYLLKDLKRAEARSKPKINPDQKLSLCMIVRNEEKYLEDCLKSAQDVVDEIIIVDTGSTDKTVDIARKYGAQVFFMEWANDFAKARNESLKHATGDWVLIMDADERIPSKHKENLRSLLIPTEQAISYLIYIRNYMREEDESSVLGHYMVRLFRKVPESRFYGVIHEQLYPNWGEVTIPENTFYLNHLGYGKLDTKEKKIEERNLPLIRKALEDTKDRNPSLYSFYAYYMGASLTEVKEIKYWMRQSIDACPDLSNSAHIPVAYMDHMRANYYGHEFAEGVEVAEEALQNTPAINNYPDFWEMFGIILLGTGDIDRAIDAFKQSRELVTEKTEDTLFFATHSDRIGGWGTLMNLGLAYALKKEQVKAKEYFAQALEAFPSEDKTHLVERIDKIIGNPELTQGYFEERLKQDQKHNAYDVKILSNSYLKQEKPFEALMLQQELHGIDKTIESALELARTYERSQRLDLAQKTYEGILSLQPECLQAQMGLRAMELLQASQPTASAEGAEQNAEQETVEVHLPQTEELQTYREACQTAQDWKALGEFCLRFQLLDEAEKAYQNLAKLQDPPYEAELYLALVDQERQNLNVAAERLQSLIQNHPQRPEAHTQLGNLCLFEGQFQPAESCFRKVIELEAGDWYSHYALGIALAGQEHFAEAEEALQTAQKMAPGQSGPGNMLKLIAQAKAQMAAAQS